MEQGVTFFDTAELYQTYDHIRHALKGWDKEVVIATKSYAVDEKDARRSLEKARREMDRDVIDIFMLHEQESDATLRGHARALEFLSRAKQAGIIRAVGISTHFISGVRAATNHPQIDVIHPLINLTGLGIVDGSRDQMASAILDAAQADKGIFAMKALGGGSLFHRAEESLSYVRNLRGVHSVAVGMGCREDIDANVGFFADGYFPQGLEQLDRERRLVIEPWCDGCSCCIAACANGALSLDDSNMVVVDHSKCVLCSYCVPRCTYFNIKVV
jgi:predicted aldo/keto reductase-like oxidoreductase